MRHKKLILVFIIVFTVIGGLFFYQKINSNYYSIFNSKSNNEEVNENTTKDKISGDLEVENNNENKIINILLLGIDKEENVSDTIMILSLSKEKKTVKLISIMRDTYIYQGEGMANKINYAYHYGGVNGSIDTVNTVFNLDISKYVKVDFDNLISIVDYLDGVEVNIDEKEREYINACCKNTSLITSGDVTLNGEQALVFSRIRKIDSDFQRTERQRKVMFGIYNKIKNMDVLKYPKTFYTFSKSSETNMSIVELLEVGNFIMHSDENNYSNLRIPLDGTTSDSTIGVYHLNWDEEVNKQALYDFIYS